MKKQLLLSLGAVAALLLPSCITAAATAATSVAGSAMGGTAGMSALGLRSLMSSGAPESLEGCTLSLTGTPANTTLAFPKGVETNMGYARLSDKTATLTCATEAGSDVYHLTFTGAKEGTYALESRAADGSLSMGHGSFSIK